MHLSRRIDPAVLGNLLQCTLAEFDPTIFRFGRRRDDQDDKPPFNGLVFILMLMIKSRLIGSDSIGGVVAPNTRVLRLELS